MADWSRIVNTTIKEYIRDVEINVMRNRKLTALLQSKGRVSMNHSGDGMDWKVRYKRAPMVGYADTDTITFSRRDKWKTAQLDWRGYVISDSMTKGEKLKNKGVPAIVQLYAGIAKGLLEDMEDEFGDEMYINGYASGNQKRMHGIESFFNSATAGSGLGVPVGVTSATYANLSTQLGYYGGQWGNGVSATWPNGAGDAHYDFWSPVVVDYTNTNLTATTKTWPNTCVESLRYGIIKSQRNKSQNGMLDMILLENELYRQWLAQLDTKERIIINRGSKSGGLQQFGFTDVQNFDGVEVTWEYGTPAGVGYGFNVDQMELRSMQGQLFVPEGPDYDVASKSWRFSVDFFGNLVFNPRYMCKFMALGGT